jgi:transposase
MSNMHPGWDKLSRLPSNVVICPRCGAPHQDKAHNWQEDAISGATTCTRPSCMERGRPIGLTVGQRRYPPTAQ